MANPVPESYFFASGCALDSIKACFEGAKHVRIATAFIDPSGLELLLPVITGKQVSLLVGRKEGGSDKAEDFIESFMEQLADAHLREKTKLVRDMIQGLKENRLFVSIAGAPMSLDTRYRFQHAKLYIADQKKCLLTSANVSTHGLLQSREAGYLIEDAKALEYFVEKFDEYFNSADLIGDKLLSRLLEYLEAHTPWEIYARSLLEVYGLPQREQAALPNLAEYQVPMVAKAVQNIRELGGCYLVAATGLGKTIMAGHVVSHLQVSGDIRTVIIFSPAGLREMWRRTMRSAGVSSVEFSYHTLSSDDPLADRKTIILKHEFENANEHTLLILDESHNLRNPAQRKNEDKLRNRRIKKAVQKGCKILMLTATPFSRDVEDINAQLALLPKREAAEATLLPGAVRENIRIARVQELSELPGAIVLTGPTVVRYFSKEDSEQNRYVIFGDSSKRYFPQRLHIRSVLYTNPFDEFFEELLRKQLLRVASANEELYLFGDTPVQGKNLGGFNAQLLPQICSSSSQVVSLMEKLASETGFENIIFARQKELSKLVRKYYTEARKFMETFSEPKLMKLAEILKSHPDSRAVIFCHYKATAAYLVRALAKHFPKRRVDTNADKQGEDLERVIRAFAPVSNDTSALPKPENQVDILVATSAIAEGFNLQDANLLINFDLPWTVLILAQRMGRILRPWHEPREIWIYNLIPSTMSREGIKMGLHWQKRLAERSKQLKQFADIPVFSSRSHDELSMMELSGNLARFETVDMTASEAIDFVAQSDGLETSSFLNDLAMIGEDEADRILSLPAGIKSAKAASNLRTGEMLYVLFRMQEFVIPVLFDHEGNIFSEKRDEVFSLIRSSTKDPILSFEAFHSGQEYDDRLYDARETWRREKNLLPDMDKIVCSMVLKSL